MRQSASAGSTAVSELGPERVRPLLGGSFGDPYLYVGETRSTQDLLRDSGHPHGAVAVAEHQTHGRGRSGRRWDDTPSTALLFSIVLRPPATAPLPQLSLVVGLAVARAIEQETRLEAMVKWPNDVLVRGHKVAGILLEASGAEVVGGVGINVNQEKPDLPSVTRVAATSLRLATGRRFDRGVLLASVLSELEQRYAEWLAEGLASFAEELEQRNALRGRRVRVAGRSGTAASIAFDGRLEIVLDRGDAVLVESGEVELLSPERGG